MAYTSVLHFEEKKKFCTWPYNQGHKQIRHNQARNRFNFTRESISQIQQSRVAVVGCVLNNPVSVSVSAQDGIVALRKAHTRSAPSLSSLPKVALETVPIFAWLNTDRSRPWRAECRPLPFSTPLSFWLSMLWCSGLSVLRKFLKPLNSPATCSSHGWTAKDNCTRHHIQMEVANQTLFLTHSQ